MSFRNSSGVDITTLWAPINGGLTQVVGYRNSSGVDLGSLYASRSQMYLWEQMYGTQTDPVTGFRNSSGTDLGSLFAHAGKATTLKGIDILNYQQWTNTTVAMSQNVTPNYTLENGYKPPLSWNWSIIGGDSDGTLTGANSETCTITTPTLSPFALRRYTLQLQLTDLQTGIVLTDTCSVQFAWDVSLSPGGSTSSSGDSDPPPPAMQYTGATAPGALYAIQYTATDGSMVDGGTIARYQTVTLYFVDGAPPNPVTYLWSIGPSTKTGSPTPGAMEIYFTTTSSAECVATSGTPNLASTSVSADVTVTVTDTATGASATDTDTITFTWTKSGS